MRQANKFFRHLVGRVAVAHPNREGFSESAENPIRRIHFDIGQTVLAMRRLFHATAEMLGHKLHAVADA